MPKSRLTIPYSHLIRNLLHCIQKKKCKLGIPAMSSADRAKSATLALSMIRAGVILLGMTWYDGVRKKSLNRIPKKGGQGIPVTERTENFGSLSTGYQKIRWRNDGVPQRRAGSASGWAPGPRSCRTSARWPTPWDQTWGLGHLR